MTISPAESIIIPKHSDSAHAGVAAGRPGQYRHSSLPVAASYFATVHRRPPAACNELPPTTTGLPSGPTRTLNALSATPLLPRPLSTARHCSMPNALNLTVNQSVPGLPAVPEPVRYTLELPSTAIALRAATSPSSPNCEKATIGGPYKKRVPLSICELTAMQYVAASRSTKRRNCLWERN